MSGLDRQTFFDNTVPFFESKYLRGLCQQSLGNYFVAMAAYNEVISKSQNGTLQNKAKHGFELCKAHIKAIPKDMTTFPNSEISPSVF